MVTLFRIENRRFGSKCSYIIRCPRPICRSLPSPFLVKFSNRFSYLRCHNTVAEKSWRSRRVARASARTRLLSCPPSQQYPILARTFDPCPNHPRRAKSGYNPNLPPPCPSPPPPPRLSPPVFGALLDLYRCGVSVDNNEPAPFAGAPAPVGKAAGGERGGHHEEARAVKSGIFRAQLWEHRCRVDGETTAAGDLSYYFYFSICCFSETSFLFLRVLRFCLW